MKKESRKDFVYWLTVVATILTFVALVVVGVAEAYVRWKLNQNFSFLGEFGIPSLTFLFVGLIWNLTNSQRS